MLQGYKYEKIPDGYRITGLKEQIKLANIPEGVVEIAGGAFSDSKIVELILPKSLKRICRRAFSNCALLKRIDFNDEGELELIASQAFLECDSLTEIILPHGFLAEEKENDEGIAEKECCIIIDPIDGTANFINGYRHSCISLAIVSKGEVIFGAVYDPYQNELFSAAKGGGAFLNGRPISVANRPIERAIVAFGTTPYQKNVATDKTFALVRSFFLKANDVRRLGAAALDLAYIAAGRNDIFFEATLQPWDVAAGILLVKESGGIITDLDGNPLPVGKPTPVLASSSSLHRTALQIAADALKEI